MWQTQRMRRVKGVMTFIHSHDAASEAEAAYRRMRLMRGRSYSKTSGPSDDVFFFFFKNRRRYVSGVCDVAPSKNAEMRGV